MAVSKSLCSDGSERVASVLEGYGGVLSQLGWELLSMLSPHLNTSHYHTLQLCQHITEVNTHLCTLWSADLVCRLLMPWQVCSAKEMCLAILEQMELSPKPAAVFLLLRILRTGQGNCSTRTIVHTLPLPLPSVCPLAFSSDETQE